jgi:hypothetical protein
MKASEVQAEVEKLEPAAQQAYLDQIAMVAKSVSVTEIEQAIEDGDESRLEEIIALGLLALFLDRLRSAFASGAARELAGIRMPGVRRELDMSAESVNAFLSSQARDIREQAARDQMDAARIAITQGRLRGDSSRTIALNMVGRRSKQTGRRSGGVLGLTGNATEAVERARDQLSSGDPGQLREYLTRKRRDPRFDSVVSAAIDAGKPLPKETLERAASAYAQRLRDLHAEALAQTNIAEAYNKGREEGWKQLTARSGGQYTYVKKWRTRMDGRERRTHGALNGQTTEAGQAFTSPSGAMLMFPCDTSLGAPLSERIRCRCVAEYSLKKVTLVV